MNPRVLIVLAALGCAAVPGGARAAGPSLAAPEFLALRAAASNELAAARARDGGGARAVLDAAVKEWSAQLAEKTRTRNVKGMAVANSALSALNKAAEGLAKNGKLEWPADLRRELVEPMDKVKADVAAAQAQAGGEAGKVQDKYFALFVEAVKKAAPEAAADEAALRAIFDPWLAGRKAALPGAGAAAGATPAGAAAAAGGTAPAAGGAAPDAAAAPAKAEPPEFFAESRPGENWKPFARWTAEMMGPDILNVPVYGRGETQSGQQANPMSGQTSKWKFESLESLPPGRYAFRLRRLGKLQTVDVETWPDSAADARLVIRTRNVTTIPAPTGFELQYASAANLIEVPVKSEPSGARIFVDGQPYLEDGREARTPCVLRLAAGKHAIRMSRDGCLDQTDPAFVVRPRCSIGCRLPPTKAAANATSRAIGVDAMRSWSDAAVTLKAGDRVRVESSGQWACGAKGELCGPGGYPNNQQYVHYYLNPLNSPRQLPGAPYGALLGRVGKGEPFLLGAGNGFIAKEAGPLKLDINEAEDPKIRRDNKGSIEVRLVVTPAP